MTERFTDEQLAEWLYDAEYQWDRDAAEHNYDYDANPMPTDSFPKYYADNYNPTLAGLFREIIESRARIAAVLALHHPAKAHQVCQKKDCPCGGYECCAHCDEYSARGVHWPCDTYKAIMGTD